MDFPRFNEQELSGKEWLVSNMDTPSRVYADGHGYLLLFGQLFGQVGVFWSETSEIPGNTYIYLRSWNVREGKVMHSSEEFRRYVERRNSPFYQEVLMYRNKIYDNGGAQVYR